MSSHEFEKLRKLAPMAQHIVCNKVQITACGYIIVWFVIYCFPFALPTSKPLSISHRTEMNTNQLIQMLEQ